jgi:hypothetical protein
MDSSVRSWLNQCTPFSLDLDVLDVSSGPFGSDQLGLRAPICDSARALS